MKDAKQYIFDANVPQKRVNNWKLDFGQPGFDIASLAPDECEAVATELARTIDAKDQEFQTNEKAATLLWVQLPYYARRHYQGCENLAKLVAVLVSKGFKQRASNLQRQTLWQLWLNDPQPCPLEDPFACVRAVTVIPFIVDPDGTKSVILLQRAGDAERPATFTSLNETLRAKDNETPEEGALRGLREELGFELPPSYQLVRVSFTETPGMGKDIHGRDEFDENTIMTVTLKAEEITSKIRVLDPENTGYTLVPLDTIFKKHHENPEHITFAKIAVAAIGNPMFALPINAGWTKMRGTLFYYSPTLSTTTLSSSVAVPGVAFNG